MQSFVTPLTSMNTTFEIDRVIIIPHNGAFSDNGRKPAFSVIMWPLKGKNLANVDQKWVKTEHSPNKCTHLWKQPFSPNFINFLAIQYVAQKRRLGGQNEANGAQ